MDPINGLVIDSIRETVNFLVYKYQDDGVIVTVHLHKDLYPAQQIEVSIGDVQLTLTRRD